MKTHCEEGLGAHWGRCDPAEQMCSSGTDKWACWPTHLGPHAPLLAAHHLDLHLYQDQESIPPSGFTGVPLPVGLGGFCKTPTPKAVVLWTRGSHVTSLCCLFQALTKGYHNRLYSAAPNMCSLLRWPGTVESNCSPTEGEGFQHRKPAKTKTCRLETKPGKLRWMRDADISAMFYCYRNSSRKIIIFLFQHWLEIWPGDECQNP